MIACAKSEKLIDKPAAPRPSKGSNGSRHFFIAEPADYLVYDGRTRAGSLFDIVDLPRRNLISRFVGALGFR